MASMTDRIAIIISATAGGAVQEFKKLEASAKGVEGAVDKMGKQFGLSIPTMKAGLVAGAAALVGMGIALKNLTDGYANAALEADKLAKSTNSSVQESAKFSSLAKQIGLDFNSVVEIFADFQKAAGANRGELERLGVVFEENSNGTVNWTRTLVNFLDVLQEIPDATERNLLLFKYLGDEGGKQMLALVAGGKSVKEAFEQITSPFDENSVRKAAEYKVAMQDFGLASQNAAHAIGEALLPVMTTLAEVAADVIGALDSSGIIDFGVKWGVLAAAFASSIVIITNLKRAVDMLMASLIRNPLTAIIVGITAVGAAIWQKFSSDADKAADSYNTLVQTIDSGTGKIKDNADSWKVLNEWISTSYNDHKLKALGTNIKELGKALQGSDQDFGAFVKARREYLEQAGFGEEQIDKEARALWNLRNKYQEAGEEAKTFQAVQQQVAVTQKDLLDAILAGERGSQGYVENLARMKEATQRQSEAEAQLQEDLRNTILTFEDYIAQLDAISQEKGAGASAVLNTKDAIEDLNKSLEESPAKWDAYFNVQGLEASKQAILAGFKEVEAAATPEDAGFILKGLQQSIDLAKGKNKEVLQAYFNDLKAKWEATGTVPLETKVQPIIDFQSPQVKDITAKYNLRDPTQFKKYIDDLYGVSGETTVKVTQNVTVHTVADPPSLAKAQSDINAVVTKPYDATIHAIVDTTQVTTDLQKVKDIKIDKKLVTIQSDGYEKTLMQLVNIREFEMNKLKIVRITTLGYDSAYLQLNILKNWPDSTVTIKVKIVNAATGALMNTIPRVSQSAAEMSHVAYYHAAPVLPNSMAAKAPVVNHYTTNNFTVEGALDPVGVARQISSIVNKQEVREGRRSPGWI